MDFVIHELLKDVNGPVKDRYRESLTPPTAREESFVKEVTLLFRKHQSGRVYGDFQADTNAYPLSRLISEYSDSSGFLVFSQQAGHLLASIIKEIPAATGGYFFVVRVQSDEEDQLLIFMLSQRMGHAVNKETLTLEAALNLEMQHLDLAAQISLSDWEAGKPEPVSLIRGRKKVSDYFKHFIGLYEPHTNTEATKALKQFAEQWMEDHEFTREDKDAATERVLDYAKKRGAEPVELQVIATLVDPVRHEEFFEAANNAELGAEFHIDRRSLAAWGQVAYADKDIRLTFATAAA